MTPLDLLLTSLAFLAGALGLWLVVCFVIAGVVFFKPRGKRTSLRDDLNEKDLARRANVTNSHTIGGWLDEAVES